MKYTGNLYEEEAATMTSLRYLSVITFLLAPSALSVAKLSGENLCHKRETYTVTMRVLVKEPVQVKSYTWCFKVPPRCTKYKVEMRDKYKIQTELREQVVDVCCAGYAPDSNETHCLPICNRCLHGVCASPNTCTCEPGYTGQHCDTECSEGVWGTECKEECLCRNGADCHHVNGDCKCSDGWRGITCDIPCPKGTYGHACLNECNCSEDGKNSTCHHITGDCFSPQTTNTFSAKPADMDNSEELSTTAIINSATTTALTTQNIAFPNTEKHVLYIDKYTTIASDTISSLKTVTVTTPLTTIMTTVAIREPSVSTVQHEVTTISFVRPTSPTVGNKDEVTTNSLAKPSSPTVDNKHEVTTNSLAKSSPTVGNKHEVTTNSLAKPSSPTVDNKHEVTTNSFARPTSPTVEGKPKEDSDSDQNDKLNSLNSPTIRETEESEEEKEASTQPHNIQIPPRGIIVVSDGLMSDRRDEEEIINESKDSKDSLWDLVSSVSAAGGVALALIVMAVITLVVSHLRNKEKVSISGNKSTDVQQSSAPRPQMYNYTEDVSISQLRHLFPDATHQPSRVEPTCDGLELRFGDVASTASSIPHPYSDMRAYLELQYDIPPSSISSKTSSFQPGLEPEHLYDEIPCSRRNTDTSPC